ncbi:MAG: AmmeMemoRadiSam system protein B [Bacteroidales bacterium]|nr:AmmeMemoRadiSam system protein B [Bacteroidales bacterium]
MKNRSAVVEGRFYPATKNKIFDQIHEIEITGRYPVAELSPERIFGAVLPHAGHIYSGHQTIPFFKLINRLGIYPETFIIVHPNHSGSGLPLAIDEADVWTNSIGEVPVDRELALALSLPFDPLAHAREHSAEVIIPFLQYYLPDHPFSIVPVCMMDQSYKSASLVAERIHEAIKGTGKNIMLLASCDFSHFLPPAEGQEKDQMVIDEIVARNPKGIEKIVKEQHISVCGYGPIMVLMEYSRVLYAEYSIEILARGHSGQVNPSREVVDYISMIMFQ